MVEPSESMVAMLPQKAQVNGDQASVALDGMEKEAPSKSLAAQ
jgi:hypothetical protein